MSEATDKAALRRTAMMWAFVTLLQAERLRQALGDLNAAKEDQFFIDQREAGALSDEWERHVEEEGGEGMTWRVRWTAGADAHFFLSAAAQLRKCAIKLPGELPEVPDKKMLRLLRDIHEHWEQSTGRSVTELREQIPDVEPGRIMFNKHDATFEGVSMDRIVDWALDVRRALLARAQETGEDLPDPYENPGLP